MSSNSRRNFVTHGGNHLQILQSAPTRRPISTSSSPIDQIAQPKNSTLKMDQRMQEKFIYMLERVTAPLYMGPRGVNNNFYSVPTDGMSAKEIAIMTEMRKNMSSVETANTQNFAMNKPRNMPDVAPIGMACPRQEHFSLFLPAHREAAIQLSNILIDEGRDLDDFMNVAAACRDSPMINSHLWVHAIIGAVLKRKDMRGVKIPALWEVMPDLVLPESVKKIADIQAQLPMKNRSIILVNGPAGVPRTGDGEQQFVDITTGRNENPENKLAYWREDVGVASHHWHWHIIYPGNNSQGIRDRRGELFYYMHHSMIARYDAERLSNGLARVRSLDIASGPILEEGYFSKLTSQNSGENWGTRQEGTQLRSVVRTDGGREFQVGIEDLRKWKDRLLDAIDTGVILTQASGRKNLNTISKTSGPDIDPDTGIDILGNLMESAEDYSDNVKFYGNMHNMGHVIIGYAHDPEKRHNEKIGVMGAEATTVRDPAFFRWHKFIDEMFDKYKQTRLEPYREEQLVWKGIRVTHVEVQSPKLERNHLRTNLRWTDIDLSRGLDFGKTNNTMGEIWARITHLDHLPFVYNITIVNDLPRAVQATVRIFIAPRHNEQGEEMPMIHQRLMFIEMDKFPVNLRPGETKLTQHSKDSSVTIPWEQTFRDVEKSFTAFREGDRNGTPSAREALCGCGWPDHLLVPRGTASGMIFDLFVMVTDGSKDQLPRQSGRRTENSTPSCKSSISYCGILDSKYPDLLPMGFPFDRAPRMVSKNGINMPVSNLKEFIKNDSNMRSVQVTITHDQKDIRMRENANGAPAGMDVIMSQSVMEQMAREGKMDTMKNGVKNRPRANDIQANGWRRVGRSSDDSEDEHFM